MAHSATKGKLISVIGDEVSIEIFPIDSWTYSKIKMSIL